MEDLRPSFLETLNGEDLLLWGCGKGCTNFLEKFHEKLNIVGVIDSNAERKDQKIYGCTVAGPEKLGSFAFSKIVITTQWVADVKTQLKGIVSDEKIIIPPKSALKSTPFLFPPTRDYASSVLGALTDHLYRNGILTYLDFGTLLGAARDGEIIEWDDDVDITVVDQNLAKLEWCLSKFRIISIEKPQNWLVIRYKENSWGTIGYGLRFPGSDCLQPFELSIHLRRTEQDNLIHLTSFGAWSAPSRFFSSGSRVSLMGLVYNAPQNYQDYLTLLYGANWRTPARNFSFNDYTFDNQPLSYNKKCIVDEDIL